MKCLLLGVSLLLGLLNSGTAQDEDDHEIRDKPSLVLSNGSSPVLLPCSAPSPDQIIEVQWTFTPALGNGGVRLCTIKNEKPQCSSPQYQNVKLAESNGFKKGNYSLWFTPTKRDAGNYQCNLYGELPNKVIETYVMVISVSVTPAGPIPLGSSVSLTCEMSDPSYFNSIDWKIKNTKITGGRFEIQWKRNRTLIHKDKRHKFDFRSLNISKFQPSDVGRYTYTIKIKNGMSCYYNLLLEIAASPKNSKKSIIITGAVVGVVLVVLALIIISLLIKRKCKPAVFVTTAQNAAQDDEVNYATVNLDALGNPRGRVNRSSEAAVYAEIKPN
ncbi:junctional adhesion molecule C-like isoform X2 [Heptranchias perlo]|uniref:junctional adhesion molecule C-like isoform X2 n=1 Tax=Heptranchias perlo TaxID=212740 RepID=UPI00355A22D6